MSKFVAGVALYGGAVLGVTIHARDHTGGDFLRENLAPVDGTVIALYVKDGDDVKTDETLIQLE